MRISDWSSDVCSSDLGNSRHACGALLQHGRLSPRNSLATGLPGKSREFSAGTPSTSPALHQHFKGTSMRSDRQAPRGSLHSLTLESALLRDNLLGDPPRPDVPDYLPAGPGGNAITLLVDHPIGRTSGRARV